MLLVILDAAAESRIAPSTPLDVAVGTIFKVSLTEKVIEISTLTAVVPEGGGVGFPSSPLLSCAPSPTVRPLPRLLGVSQTATFPCAVFETAVAVEEEKSYTRVTATLEEKVEGRPAMVTKPHLSPGRREEEDTRSPLDKPATYTDPTTDTGA